MKNNRTLYIIIAVLCVWVLVLSVAVIRKGRAVLPNEISEYNVSGFSTDLSKVYDQNKSSVVTVEHGSELSSGFIYAKRDDKVYIVTTYHGVSGGNDISVHFNNGYRIRASLKDYDVFADVALLECEFEYEVKPVSLGDSSLVSTGEFVLGIGVREKLDYDFSSQFGMVSSRYREVENNISFRGSYYSYYEGLIQLSGEFSKGYSGCPVFNMNGEAIGMITMEDGSIVFALPVNEIRIIADRMMEEEDYTKLQLGTGGRYIADLEKYETVSLNINVETIDGYYVESVRPGSLASTLGINRGDIITSINGTEIKNSDAMLKICYSEMNEIEAEIIRNGEKFTLRGSISSD